MDSIKKADSCLSISSIVSDSNQSQDDSEEANKVNYLLKHLLEAGSDTIAENSALGNEIIELFDDLKYDVKSLPTDLRDGMQTVAAILKSEGLPSFDEIALQLCLEKKKIQNKKKEREERLLKAKYNADFTKYNVLQEKLNPLLEEIDRMEDALKMSDNENAETNRIFMSNKFHAFKEAIEKLEEELNTLHSEDIELNKTLQKSSVLMDKMDELSQLNNILEKYGDLPPNLLQAKNILECKKKELEEIEYLISEKINN